MSAVVFHAIFFVYILNKTFSYSFATNPNEKNNLIHYVVPKKSWNMNNTRAVTCCGVLTVQAEGDVDHSLLGEALQIGDLGTFEVCG